MPEQPSCFHVPSMSLALGVYVDDLTLSGPQKNHSKFWSTLQKHVQLEEPAELSKVLGRNHVMCESGDLPFTQQTFAKQCVELYEQLSCKKVKHFRTPHCDGGTLVETDDQCVGTAFSIICKTGNEAYVAWTNQSSRHHGCNQHSCT